MSVMCNKNEVSFVGKGRLFTVFSHSHEPTFNGMTYGGDHRLSNQHSIVNVDKQYDTYAIAFRANVCYVVR